MLTTLYIPRWFRWLVTGALLANILGVGLGVALWYAATRTPPGTYRPTSMLERTEAELSRCELELTRRPSAPHRPPDMEND